MSAMEYGAFMGLFRVPRRFNHSQNAFISVVRVFFFKTNTSNQPNYFYESTMDK